MTAQERRHEKLREEAAEWIVRARALGVPPEADANLTLWRRSGRAHEAAFAEVIGTWEAAHDLKEHPRYPDLMGAPTFRERWISWRSRVSGNMLGMLRPSRLAFASLATALITGSVWVAVEKTWAPDYQTQIAEIHDVPLNDGSVVTLGAKSKLDVEFNDRERRVELARGEAFFSVAKDVHRPFVVVVGKTIIRVVGTKFNVNYESGRVRVSVLEGVVEVMRAEGTSERVAPVKVTLTAGQQAVDAASLATPALQPTEATDPGGWREGRLSYQDAPLGDIIADINRYRGAEIRLASPSLGNERLTTSFTISQIDQMIEQLPQLLSVQIQRNPDGTVILKSI